MTLNLFTFQEGRRQAGGRRRQGGRHRQEGRRRQEGRPRQEGRRQEKVGHVQHGKDMETLNGHPGREAGSRPLRAARQAWPYQIAAVTFD